MGTLGKWIGTTGLALLVFCTFAGCTRSLKYEYKDEYIRITRYTGVEADVEDPGEASEADIDYEIQEELEGMAERKSVDRPAEVGDVAAISYSGGPDGMDTEDSYEFEVSEDSMFGVEGHKKGDTYEWEDASGTYAVTVQDVAEMGFPELTDALVKKMSEKSDTVDEYRKEIRDRLTESMAAEYREYVKTVAFDRVLGNTEVESYPEKKVKEAEEKIREQYRDAARDSGVDYETYVRDYMGYNMEQFEEDIKEAAQTQVKESMVVEVIAGREGIKSADMDTLAQECGYRDAEEMYGDIGKDDAQEMALVDAVKTWVAEKSKK